MTEQALVNDLPTISACMMVKNEEEMLPNCLESIKDVVDELIVVDTGSTDKTIEIAESYGAKIYHHPWENDFSKHRNQSISYATGDWFLII
ncbi:MAG: glycosyltransferase family 2 protein, partial [Calditrichota bacterium]